MIAVTGAAGKTGCSIVARLVAEDRSVRAVVRRQAQEPTLRRLGATEVVVACFEDAPAIREALRGCSAVYHIAPNVHPHEEAFAATVIDASVGSSVTHLVFHSVLQPEIRAMPHHWRKARVEKRLEASELPFTILQPTAYIQNHTARADEIARTGTLAVPYSLDARVTLVDLDDVAAAAAVVLESEAHFSRRYPLCSDDSPTAHELAEVFAQALGRPVVARRQPLDEWERSARRSGLDPQRREVLAAMFEYYDQQGMLGSSGPLTDLLGRPPIGFARAIERCLRDVDS